jgi:hypothetical protein
MAKRPEVNTADGFALSPEAYTHMKAAMMELAMRGSREEAIVMRIAKAGAITEVTKDLIRLRNYGKKMGLVRAPKPPKGEGKAKATRKRGRGNAGQGEGAAE